MTWSSDPWKRLVETRSYTPHHIDALQERLRFARNIGTHGADAALLNLGWTAGDRQVAKDVVIPASDLVFTALHRDLSPLIFAVGYVLDEVWKRILAADFDDAVFGELFD
jgi:hypothetical protein